MSIDSLRQVFINRNKSLIASLILAVILVLNLFIAHSVMIGIAAFLIYSLFISQRLGLIISRFIPVDPALKTLFGFIFWIYALAFYGAIFIVFFKLTATAIALIFPLFPLLVFFGSRGVSGNTIQVSASGNNSINLARPRNRFIYFVRVILPALFIVAFVILAWSRTDKYILSPWEVIPKLFLVLVFVISFLVFIHIFNRARVYLSLIFIVALSILIHSYLPAVYKNGYGGDKWRHLAIERSISSGHTISPSLLDKPLAFTELGPIKVPTVLITGNKTSYANQWAITVILGKLFASNVFWIDHILVFILWSVFIPLIFYQIGLFLRPGDKTFALLLSAATLLFYILQVNGSTTVPFSFGHIFFAFCLMVLIGLAKFRVRRAGYIILILTMMLYLNYVLTFVLWALLLAVLSIQLGLNKLKLIRYSWVRLAAILLMICLVAVSVTALDTAYGKIFKLNYGSRPDSVNLPYIGHTVKEWVNSYFGTNLLIAPNQASGEFNISPHGIYPSNNPQVLFFSNFAIAVLLLVGLFFNRGNTINRVLMVFIGGIFIVLYVNTYFFQNGPRPLSNRIILDFYLFSLPAIALGIKKVHSSVFRDSFVGTQVISTILATFLVINYSIAPSEPMVTVSEVKAMESVYQEMSQQTGYEHVCVISDTWPLLAMQAVSANSIIGGGFPMYADFAQPERVEIQKGLFEKPELSYLQRAFDITGAKTCYLATEQRWTSDLRPLTKLMGPYRQVGNVSIFSINRQSFDSQLQQSILKKENKSKNPPEE